MGDVVNLNKRRKTRERDAAKERAAENRAKFGQPKVLRDQQKKETERAAKDLDGKKLD
ncbi:DUF4169 family protein [Ferrovibrio sp.]|uniref:DUF4169 family protein n=1 Tax=Ferrovibrio sp. TaxID=1917215 RepID=UPI00260D543B|nr:DUF4169 family protein [Ferrovibrio sp.]